MRYGTLRYCTVRFGTARYGTVYGTVWYGTVRYAVRYGTVRYSTVRYGTVKYLQLHLPTFLSTLSQTDKFFRGQFSMCFPFSLLPISASFFQYNHLQGCQYLRQSGERYCQFSIRPQGGGGTENKINTIHVHCT